MKKYSTGNYIFYDIPNVLTYPINKVSTKNKNMLQLVNCVPFKRHHCGLYTLSLNVQSDGTKVKTKNYSRETWGPVSVKKKKKRSVPHYNSPGLNIVSCFKGVASPWPLLWRWSVANPLRNNGALTTVYFLISSNSIATQLECSQ